MDKKVQIFSLLAGALCLSACHSELMNDLPTGKGELNLASLKTEVNTDIETVYLGSRAASSVDVSEFLVTVFDTQQREVSQYTYGKMPEIISLGVGTYTVEVTSSKEPSRGFDVPYYKGTATCEVKENQVSDVASITCTLANMPFTVEYDDNFKGKLGDDVVTTLTIGSQTLDIPVAETRTAYLVAPTSETTSVTVTLTGTVDGEKLSYSERFEQVKTHVHNIIKYKFTPVSDGSGADASLGVSVDVDSSMEESDEVVGVNPGEEPGIDDFPTEGGDQQPGDGGGTENTPQITGSNFNGKPFDIANDVLEISTGVDMLNPIPLQVTLTAPEGMAHVYVTIDSQTLTDDILTGVGLASNFDLAEPGNLQKKLKDLGFPTGDEVKGQTSIPFDITQFTPLLGMYGAATHNFIIRVVDNKGNEETQTLKIKSVE